MPARHPAASRAEPGYLLSETSTSIGDAGRFVLYGLDQPGRHPTAPELSHLAENADHAIVPLPFKRDRGRYQPLASA